jgi:TerC family integral membrane protein
MTALPWLGFLAFVLALLALDLGVFHRQDREITIKEALAWSAFWISLSLAFNVLIYALYQHHWFGVGDTIGHQLDGREAALQFFTGYLVEKSLSVDNIFVIAMIFAYFGVPLALQHRALYWGILGALVLRGVMIAAGAAMIARFAWVTYAFGILLLATAIKLLVVRHDNLQPEKNPLVRLIRRFLPVTEGFEGRHFMVRLDGRWAVTPLGIALAVVESSDVLFAVDSIPAIFAITRDPFLVFTSNVCAILGLRSLYFALAGTIQRFRYLKSSLVFLLAFIGVKMLLAHHYPISNVVALAVVFGILVVGVAASMVEAYRDTAALESPLADELERLTQVGWRQGRRIAILITGSTVVLIGVAMIVLPGPASLVIPAGLSILAIEFVWARRWLAEIRKAAERVGIKLKPGRSNKADGEN